MKPRNEKITDLRVDNIKSTQKSIQRLLSSIYVLFILVIIAWFASNFESTELSEKIDELDQALRIEELRRWDEYLYDIASCFDNYFFGNDGRLVSPKKLDRKSTRLNSSHIQKSRMPSSA